MAFLFDRFTEFDLFVLVVPILVKASVVAYPILQALALWRMTGWWKRLAAVPLVIVVLAAGVAAWQFTQQSPMWLALPALVVPPMALALAAMWVAYLRQRRAVQLGALSLATVGLLMLVVQQGFGSRLGGSPAAIESEYQSEDAWIVTEIVRDVIEMASYSPGGSSKHTSGVARSNGGPGLYAIESPALSEGQHQLDLRHGFWDSAEFAKVAAAALGAERQQEIAATPSNVHTLLLDSHAVTLVHLSQSQSQALKENMRSRTAHEAAALTIGTFAMREAAGRFQDVRWALNRMTAHLAMARALAPTAESELSLDGALAEATLLALANEEVRAVETLDRIKVQYPSPAAAAWDRLLRIRLTQDWRLLTDLQSASPLEKSEYVRARREGAWGTRAAPDLEALGIDASRSAHWLRIIQNGYRGVEEGHLFAETALSLERAEASEVFTRFGDTSQPLESRLNDRATRCVSSSGPAVLPWGAWAEFFQRHLAMLVGNVNRHYVLGLGSPEAAVASDVELDGQLRDFDMFAVGTTFRLRGPRGSNADLRRINDAITVAYRSPERITPEVWAWLERASGYEAVRVGMPRATQWFTGPPTPHDAMGRDSLSTSVKSIEQIENLRRRAPTDYGLATAYLRAQFGEKQPFAEIQKAMGVRLQYDLRSVNYAKKYAVDDEEQLVLLEGACRVNAIECGALAGVLARLGRSDEAAAQYEKAFADPAVDDIWKSGASRWLVDHHYRQGRRAVARQVAERAAGVGAFDGVLALARLEERDGNLQRAEELHVQAAERYDDLTQLLGFYQRRIRDFREESWQAQWTKWHPRLFPDGLQPVADTMATRPARGVVVTSDNQRARTAGIQSGDIIVGVEGYRVDNLGQYRAINASFDTDEMKLTLWRGRLFQVTATAPNRLFGIQIRSYPIEGWGEK